MNQESMDALEKISPFIEGLHLKVLASVSILHTATVKEVVLNTGLARLTVGARLTELKQSGLLEPANDRRDGCMALRLTDQGHTALSSKLGALGGISAL